MPQEVEFSSRGYDDDRKYVGSAFSGLLGGPKEEEEKHRFPASNRVGVTIGPTKGPKATKAESEQQLTTRALLNPTTEAELEDDRWTVNVGGIPPSRLLS